MFEWLALGFLAILTLALGAAWGRRRLPPELASLFVLGIVLRIVGSTARIEVMEQVYSGVGDAKMYYDFGVEYANRIQNFDFSFVTGDDSPSERWWGTQFVRSVTAFVVLLTAGSFRATFFVFSLFAYAGLVLCALAFGQAFGKGSEPTYARWIWLWPSLCFWPSSIGKDALMALAGGLAIYGYVGQGGRPRWIAFALGVALGGAIRPHVAALIALAALLAEVTSTGPLLTARRMGGIVAATIIVALGVSAGLSQLGLDDADLEGIQEEFDYRSDQTAQGGSRIEVSSGWSAVPMAFITILMRPFPWEARGIVLLSAAEMTLFWSLVVIRRRHVRALLGTFRSNAFLRYAVPFVLGISLMYGLAFANLGIIARQRSIILPFMLVLLYRVTQPAIAPSNALARTSGSAA